MGGMCPQILRCISECPQILRLPLNSSRAASPLVKWVKGIRGGRLLTIPRMFYFKTGWKRAKSGCHLHYAQSYNRTFAAMNFTGLDLMLLFIRWHKKQPVFVNEFQESTLHSSAASAPSHGHCVLQLFIASKTFATQHVF
ncbi:hypothetical protein TNCV_2804971 [Trichonephila clavipes]|nr:hypothetical protein TNCV_2804971 [Trichonephila clavipes]